MRKKPIPHIRPNRRIRPDTTLDYTVSTRLSADEILNIRALAERDGLSVAQWLRAAAVGTASLPPLEQYSILQSAGAAS